MPRLDSWDDFVVKAKDVYEDDPIRCRVTLKYRHNDGKLNVKVTDNKKVYQYSAEQPKEVKNIDKFMSTIMRTIVSQ